MKNAKKPKRKRKIRARIDSYICPNCSYVYDPYNPIDFTAKVNTSFEKWDVLRCPECHTPKNEFIKLEKTRAKLS